MPAKVNEEIEPLECGTDLAFFYLQFLGVLNTKKAKLRDLRDQLAKQDAAGKFAQEDEESAEKTETFDEETSDDAKSKEETVDAGISKAVPRSSARGRKRITRKQHHANQVNRLFVALLCQTNYSFC